MPDKKCIYFRYSKFYDDKKFPFAPVQKGLVRAIDSIHPDKLIIDLRDNGGGRISMLNPFIEQLGRSSLNRKGHIYVLIGRRTFSAAILATAELKRRTYAITVGEETSGSVSHFTHVDYFKLPHTYLRVSYSNSFVSIGERYEGSLRPDVTTPETFANYIKGVDAALEYTISQ
jgi:C-terminal processing protease CtpA/Prc